MEITQAPDWRPWLQSPLGHALPGKMAPQSSEDRIRIWNLEADVILDPPWPMMPGQRAPKPDYYQYPGPPYQPVD
jgi:hypothetical protein